MLVTMESLTHLGKAAAEARHQAILQKLELARSEAEFVDHCITSSSAKSVAAAEKMALVDPDLHTMRSQLATYLYRAALAEAERDAMFAFITYSKPAHA